jgi:hypothetical protein
MRSMRRNRLLSLAACLGLFWGCSALPSPAEVDWTVDLLPATILGNFGADGFKVSGDGQEETVSIMSSLPNVSGGISLPNTRGHVDFKAGGGVLINGSLSAYMAYLSGGIYSEVKPGIFLGPHVALTHFWPPDWWGEPDITFSDSNGFFAGLHITAGDRISYALSVDYLYAIFDVDRVPAGYTTSDSELNLSGLVVQFGIRAQF